MPRARIVRSTPIKRSARVMQLEGMFQVPPSKKSQVAWEVHLPLDERPWSVGLVVGPSGCGKSTLARELWPAELVGGFDWPADRSIVDAFPATLGIKEISGLLSSVGFSSPPSWLRPFGVLSNGEQFRVTIARALAESNGLVVIDEFTSVVDRTVARIGSAAIAKAVRAREQRLVAVTCHYDVIEWLQPDWIFEPANNAFAWRSLRRRPDISLKIVRVDRSAWQSFAHHHYLDSGIHRAAKCFVGLVDERPAAFTAVLSFPHPRNPAWREHRTVCLPDFQGCGIGNAMSEFVASLFACDKTYLSITAHPAMIGHRARSPLWEMIRAPKVHGKIQKLPGPRATAATNRVTAGFRYVGPANHAAAAKFGLFAR